MKAFQPIRYLIEDKDIYTQTTRLFTNVLKRVYDIKISGATIPEQEQDEEVKEIFEFVSEYFKEEQ